MSFASSISRNSVALVLVSLLAAAMLAVPWSPSAAGPIGPAASSAPFSPSEADGPALAGPTYSVTFSESVLPAGANWSVTILGQTSSSTTGTLTVREPNGSYAYSAHSDASPGSWSANGSFAVAGAPAEVSLMFTPVPFPATGASTSSGGGWSGVLLPVFGAFVAILVGVVAILGVTRRRRVPAPLPQGPPQVGSERPGGNDSEPTPEAEDDPLGHML